VGVVFPEVALEGAEDLTEDEVIVLFDLPLAACAYEKPVMAASPVVAGLTEAIAPDKQIPPYGPGSPTSRISFS